MASVRYADMSTSMVTTDVALRSNLDEVKDLIKNVEKKQHEQNRRNNRYKWTHPTRKR